MRGGEDADLCPRAGHRAIRPAGAEADYSRNGCERLPLFLAGVGNCGEHAVSDDKGNRCGPARRRSETGGREYWRRIERAQRRASGRQRPYMNVITKKHISRRALLRGAGVAMALPLLDAMKPALAAPTSAAAAAVKPPVRMAFT